MCKKRANKVAISGNGLFNILRFVMGFILVGSCLISIANRFYHFIEWPGAYDNIVGVAAQIITAIISLVVSIIGIAISLQNENFFGIEITKLYGLRVNKHCPILNVILSSISLCVLNLLFYMVGLTIASIGTMLVALIYLVQVVIAEIPIMTKDEKAILRILRDNLVDCYLSNKEATKELKDAIRYLLYRKNLKEIYTSFSDSDDQEYNQYLILKLLEYQHDLAFELKDKYDEHEQRVICSSMLENTFDVLLRRVEITEEMYAVIGKNKYLLTRVLFRIHELPTMKVYLFEKISGLFQCLSFIDDGHRLESNLISDILIILAAGTVKAGNFEVYRAIRHQLSESSYCLRKRSDALTVFSVLSMYLYYLSCSDPDVPSEIKKDIRQFVDEGNIIEERTLITSWKKLFGEAANDFNVDYGDFISFSMRNEDVLEYYLFGNGAKSVILHPSYLSRWYLAHLLNARRIYALDFSSLISEQKDIKLHLKAFGEKCIDENKSFAPTDEMNRIVEFYSNDTEHFWFFKIDEERSHKFFEFINKIKYEELRNVSEKAAQVDGIAFAKKIRAGIEQAVKSEWGFDPTIEINSTERYFAVFFEKMPDAINFEESIIDYSVNSVFSDLEKATQKTVLYNDDQFETGIRAMLLRGPYYISASAKKTIPQFFITDEQIQEEFVRVCEPLTEFESRIINDPAVVLPNGFSFNCQVEKVEFRGLSEEELSRRIAKYQREDGQFVFNGVFLPRQEIMKIIESTFTVLTIVIKHQVISSKETVFELRPYANGPEE